MRRTHVPRLLGASGTAMTQPQTTDLRRERLIVHRELQLLRAAGWRAPAGQEDRKDRWVRNRARKLDEARAGQDRSGTR
jgi:hypothetical protein